VGVFSWLCGWNKSGSLMKSPPGDRLYRLLNTPALGVRMCRHGSSEREYSRRAVAHTAAALFCLDARSVTYVSASYAWTHWRTQVATSAAARPALRAETPIDLVGCVTLWRPQLLRARVFIRLRHPTRWRWRCCWNWRGRAMAKAGVRRKICTADGHAEP
jgi:hypothetical protein